MPNSFSTYVLVTATVHSTYTIVKGLSAILFFRLNEEENIHLKTSVTSGYGGASAQRNLLCSNHWFVFLIFLVSNSQQSV